MVEAGTGKRERREAAPANRGRNKRQMGERLSGEEIMEPSGRWGERGPGVRKTKDTTGDKKRAPRVPSAGPRHGQLLPLPQTCSSPSGCRGPEQGM